MDKQWRALFLICTAVLCALSLWYSASVIAMELLAHWQAPRSMEAWLSAAVPAGFVVGAFFSALLGLADRLNARLLFAVSTLLGAVVNGLLLFTDSVVVGIGIRLLTGALLAGVYPIAVKIVAQWFPQRRGTALGLLIAALTLGTAFPHVIRLFFSTFDWKVIVGTSSLLALFAAFIVQFLLKDAPRAVEKTVFSFGHLKHVVRNKQMRLVTAGYLGHKWELYAMWTWMPLFFAASIPTASVQWLALLSFVTIGVAGAIGCVVGGVMADRIGRANVTIWAMAISGTCALVIGFTFGSSWLVTLFVACVWGASIIADSAQYSASVSEVVSEKYVGTALTFQMCVGYLLTVVSIYLVPILQQAVGWQWVFTFLAIGPVVGIVAMWKFKRSSIS